MLYEDLEVYVRNLPVRDKPIGGRTREARQAQQLMKEMESA